MSGRTRCRFDALRGFRLHAGNDGADVGAVLRDGRGAGTTGMLKLNRTDRTSIVLETRDVQGGVLGLRLAGREQRVDVMGGEGA